MSILAVFSISDTPPSTTTSNVSVVVPFAFTSTFDHVIVFVVLSYPFVVTSFIFVPVGIASVTVTVPFAFPLFVNVIVYFNVSPTFASVLSTVFVPVMFATFVSVGGVSCPPTIATFVTLSVLSWFIVTSKLTVVSPFAATSTLFQVIVFPSNTPPFDIVSSTTVVPSGILSVTVIVPFAFPLFVNVIVYFNVSPTFASVLSTVFVPVMFATFVSVGGVSCPPTIATFVTLSVLSWFIVTSKLTVVSPFALTATSFHVIVLPSNFPSSDIVPSTISVPSGIVSVTVVLPGTLELFVIVITYLNVSPTFALSALARLPSTTTYTSFAVVATGVSVVGVSSPLTLAVLLINVTSVSLITFTLKVNSTVSPAFITFFQVIFPFARTPPSDIVPSTISVPSGIASTVRIVDVAKLPVFFILIT